MIDDQVADLVEMFRQMGDPTRLKIIAACLRVPMRVSDIAAKFGLAQTLVSRHLRLLRTVRVLRADRCGKQIFCVATDEHVKRVISDMAEHV
ncbi:metalloregulator ArsR/SmtB family transcription factor [Paraburkholderia sp. RAU2J]|uniref:ArsR/SmtB family transcription factor n=1 Tax=Paraburkholderia sp. RAU2J TaxID=1938810 RepID=UPI001F54699B|nr:metalloregulator ArsR/SmtB family transcription factor [Paraburkholderia sp. RAU2J]